MLLVYVRRQHMLLYNYDEIMTVFIMKGYAHFKPVKYVRTKMALGKLRISLVSY